MHWQLKSQNFPKHKKPLHLGVENSSLQPFAILLYCSRQRMQMQSIRLDLHRPYRKSRHRHRNWLRRGPFVTEEKGSGAILRTAPEISAQASLENASEGPLRASDEVTYQSYAPDHHYRPLFNLAQELSAALYKGLSYNM